LIDLLNWFDIEFDEKNIVAVGYQIGLRLRSLIF